MIRGVEQLIEAFREVCDENVCETCPAEKACEQISDVSPHEWDTSDIINYLGLSDLEDDGK